MRPSIQFENCEQKPKLLNEEKQKYIIKQKNTIQENVILKILSNGVIGEKKTMQNFFSGFLEVANLNKLSIYEILIITVQYTSMNS